MAHPVLIGEYDLTIDDKNRLLIPADIRRSIPPEYGESFFLVVGSNRVPWLYPERYYEELAAKAPTEMTPGDDRLALDHLMFAMANKLPWDKQGRVLVPEKALRRASIGKDVTLIGSRDHMELWNRADWEARHEELLKRSAEIFARARQQAL